MSLGPRTGPAGGSRGIPMFRSTRPLLAWGSVALALSALAASEVRSQGVRLVPGQTREPPLVTYTRASSPAPQEPPPLFLPGTLQDAQPAPAPDAPRTETKEAPRKEEPKKEEKKKEEKPREATRAEVDYATFGVKSLWDSLRVEPEKKKWYEKLSLRGYTQIRFGRTVDRDNDVTPQLLGDRAIDGVNENFSLRRVRLILFGDVSDHLGIYIQPDFAVTPEAQVRNTFFTQLRDCYGDIYLTTDKVHRLRAGLSKVPYGFENLQSSQNRLPLDRTEPINNVVPNERDLGLFYYWTPEDKQQLFRDLVDGGLKGSGNYGIFGFGVYNGQGGAQLETNRNLHAVARLTYPHRFESGQVVEASIQGLTGEYTVEGSALRPLGRGNAITPNNTRPNTGRKGVPESRIAGSFIYYPQPFGFQAEWQVGEGPGLTPDQRNVQVRNLNGGYVMAMYKLDTHAGVFFPYIRHQYYKGGYRTAANAPYGTTRLTELGLEWQVWKEVELVAEYTIADKLNLETRNAVGAVNYRNFEGGIFRLQLQLNY